MFYNDENVKGLTLPQHVFLYIIAFCKIGVFVPLQCI